MAAEWWYDFPEFGFHLGGSRFGQGGGDLTLMADENLPPSGKAYTPWADAIVPLVFLQCSPG